MRSDVAIPRKRAPEVGRSRRLRSREAPIRENGGTFLPTTRPDDLSQHDRRHRPATSPLGQGAPSDRIPASSRPTPGRGVRTVLWDGADACGVCPAGPTEVGPANDPKRTGRQVLLRTAWPPISITEASRTEVRQRQRPTPDSPPWEEPQPSADPRHPTPSLLGRAAIWARPDALAYWWNTDPNSSSQQPVCRYSVADSCAWIPKQRTIHRPLIHGVVHKAAVALT